MKSRYKETMEVNAAQKVILRMLKSGELYTAEQLDEVVKDNELFLCKVLTIALNESLGIGSKRFEEKVQPVVDRLVEEYEQNVKTVDSVYAENKVNQAYERIAGRDADGVKIQVALK